MGSPKGNNGEERHAGATTTFNQEQSVTAASTTIVRCLGSGTTL